MGVGGCTGSGSDGPCWGGVGAAAFGRAGCSTACGAADGGAAARDVSAPNVTNVASRHGQSDLARRIEFLKWGTRTAKRGEAYRLTAEQNEQPDHAEQHEGHEHRGRADVLCQAGQSVPLEPDAVDGCLDCAVDELYHQYEQHRTDEERALDPSVPEPKANGYDERRKSEFLPKGGFFAKSSNEPAPACPEGTQQTRRASRFVTIYDCAVGFHVRSSCLAARTSSRRRTGMVCGAPVTCSGSCMASLRICSMAATKASRVWRLSVSVGSISRHSGTSSGK